MGGINTFLGLVGIRLVYFSIFAIFSFIFLVLSKIVDFIEIVVWGRGGKAKQVFYIFYFDF